MMFWEEDDFAKVMENLGGGSTAMPGFFVPLKKIVKALTARRSGLLSKVDGAFDIADAVKQYRDSLLAEDYHIQEDIDHIEVWLEDNDCYAVTDDRAGAEILRELLIVCVTGLKRERITLKDDDGTLISTEIIKFTFTHEGVTDFFTVRFDASRKKQTADGRVNEDTDEELLRASYGPFFHITTADATPHDAKKRFSSWMTHSFWEHYGSCVIEIDFETTYAGEKPVITAGGDVKNYIGVGGKLAQVEQIAADTKLFMNAGHSRSIMLLGPPGVGKTTLTRVINKHLGGRCVILRPSFFRKSKIGPEILATLSPNVVVFDDFDRYKVDNQAMLSMLEWLPKRLSPVITVATVNDITQFDKAGLRPGRFDELVLVPPPDAEGRQLIFDYYLDIFNAPTSRMIEGKEYSQICDHIRNEGDGMTPAGIAELVKTLTVLGPELFMVKFHALARQRKIYMQIFDETQQLWDESEPEEFNPWQAEHRHSTREKTDPSIGRHVSFSDYEITDNQEASDSAEDLIKRLRHVADRGDGPCKCGQWDCPDRKKK